MGVRMIRLEQGHMEHGVNTAGRGWTEELSEPHYWIQEPLISKILNEPMHLGCNFFLPLLNRTT